MRVVGKHCETGDVVVPDAFVPDDLEVGDVLATPVTGAYGYSMASNYNKVPRPAVVFVADGKARVVVRRETFDDLIEPRRLTSPRQGPGGAATSLYRLEVTADPASAVASGRSHPHAHPAPTVRVALLGCGNVGGALAEILLSRSRRRRRPHRHPPRARRDRRRQP